MNDLKKKVAQEIIDLYNQGEVGKAVKRLKFSQGILGKKAFDYLYHRMEPDPLRKCKHYIGGKIINK